MGASRMNSAIFEGQFLDLPSCQRYCLEKNRATGHEEYPEKTWQDRQTSIFHSQKIGIDTRSESITSYLPKGLKHRVVDIGGGSGWLYEKLTAKFDSEFTYLLVETKRSLKTFESIHRFRESKNNFAISSSEEFKTKTLSASVIYINSVLQYVPNPIEFIADIVSRTQPGNLIFNDLVISVTGDFWSSQRYYGHLVPYHFLNLNDFISQIEGLGYKLALNAEYGASFSSGWDFKIDLLNVSIELDKPRSLIFKND